MSFIKNMVKNFWRFIKTILEQDIIGISAQTAFFLLTAFFPLFLFAASFLSQFNSMTHNWTEGIIPQELVILMDEAETDGFSSPWLFLITAWGASSATWALMKGVSRAYTGKPLSSIRARLMALVFTIGFAAVLTLTIALVAFGKWLGQGLALIASFVAIYALIFALYTWTPGTSARPVRAAWTAALATVGWILVSRLFGIYMSEYANYTVLYGSVGIFIGLAVWVFLISIVVIFGAQLGGYKVDIKS